VNAAETILVFAGIPLAIIAVMALLIFAPAARNRRPRYKPGQPWEHAPVWYEPHPSHGPGAGHGETLAIGSSVYGEPRTADGRAPGGALSHGATAIGSSAGSPTPAAAGPLGGARGTW
jgi:hypothetical protein